MDNSERSRTHFDQILVDIDTNIRTVVKSEVAFVKSDLSLPPPNRLNTTINLVGLIAAVVLSVSFVSFKVLKA